MVRPRPHVPGAVNAAVDPDDATKRTDSAQPSVPKSLRNPRTLLEARARAAKADRMKYIRTDTGGGGTKAGDASSGGGHDEGGGR